MARSQKFCTEEGGAATQHLQVGTSYHTRQSPLRFGMKLTDVRQWVRAHPLTEPVQP
jgi:hypothetical protein